MESPKTYRGYNSEGKVIVQQTAQDANDVINPQEVRAAIEHVKEVFSDEMYKLARSLRAITDDANEAIIVQGTKMDKTIEETAKVLEQIPGQVTNGIDSLYDESVKTHDQLQDNFNSEAYNGCRTTGVERIA